MEALKPASADETTDQQFFMSAGLDFYAGIPRGLSDIKSTSRP
jgi:hypothetical protein